VALVVAHYPTRSQTFVDRLVLALADEPSISLTLAVSGALDRRAARRVLADAWAAGRVRVVWVGGGRRSLTRAALGVWHATIGLVRTPVATARSLDPRRYGRRAARLRVAAMLPLLRAVGPQHVVHAQFLGLGVDVAAACDALGSARAGAGFAAPRLWASVRGADLTRAGAVTERDLTLLRRAGVGLLPVSASLAEALVARGVAAERIRIVPSGLDVEAIAFAPYAERPASDVWRLAFVGRLVPKKGLDVLLRALALLEDSGAERPWRLEVVGDGPLAGRWRALAAEVGIADRVDFRGAVAPADALTALRGADTVVVPSRTGPDGDAEGVPNVAKEAMAVGTVVVASDHGGLAEAIADGRTGYLFAEGAVEACAATLRRCLADRARWPEVAGAAREAVARRYGIRAMLQPLVDAYRDATASA